MSAMHIMDPKLGDLKVVWDSENEAEVQLAKKQFNDAIKKEFTAYRAKKDGSKGKKIEKFDPEAERIIMVPPVVGA